jgi:hypothetical protein
LRLMANQPNGNRNSGAMKCRANVSVIGGTSSLPTRSTTSFPPRGAAAGRAPASQTVEHQFVFRNLPRRSFVHSHDDRHFLLQLSRARSQHRREPPNQPITVRLRIQRAPSAEDESQKPDHAPAESCSARHASAR